ncbi:MAG: CvpA family protein [Bacteroidetes bacterium]|nr:CvpA family protein [Bacteroidota bacterium]MBS1539099.1 CvpA family protein [Bacteroidota bacterium]
MSKIDIALLVFFALGAYFGYKRGFLAELFFVVALVLGVFIGFKFMGWGVSYLHRQFNADTAFLPYLSFFLIFILVMIGVIFLGNRIKHLMDESFLGKVDATAGALLGIIKFAFSASVILWLVHKVGYDFPDAWKQGSWIYPKTQVFAKRVSEMFSDFIPFFKETFRQF